MNSRILFFCIQSMKYMFALPDFQSIPSEKQSGNHKNDVIVHIAVDSNFFLNIIFSLKLYKKFNIDYFHRWTKESRI